ncbi:NAD(P)H-dependent oxidoreductase subunit E [bacterium]|nr:NAD(P)H-dependent oxidoreductase subunit E [bacterium]
MDTDTTVLDLEPVRPLIESYRSGEKTIIELMLDIQGVYNYLPREVVEFVAEEAGVPISILYSLATFYSAISLTPRGRNHIRCCIGTACVVRGSQFVLENLKRELGIESGEVTEDGAFSLEEVHCLGACALGPIITRGEKFYGHVTKSRVREIINTLRRADQECA